MLLAPILQSNTEAMPGSVTLDEQRWAGPFALAYLPLGAWHGKTLLGAVVVRDTHLTVFHATR